MSKAHTVNSFIQYIQQQVVINRTEVFVQKVEESGPIITIRSSIFLIHSKNTLIEQHTKLYKKQAKLYSS